MNFNKKIAIITFSAALAITASSIGVSAAVNHVGYSDQVKAGLNLDKNGNVVDKNGSVIQTKDQLAKNANGSITVGGLGNQESAKMDKDGNVLAPDGSILVPKDQIIDGSKNPIGDVVTGSAGITTDKSGNVVDQNGNVLMSKDQLDNNSSGSITVPNTK
ncbi:hypothetical protein QNH20_10045 [Neobacillus sp. WH10]|uniref:hypothetical protein n=1 Tax=Neobacillus sp. WH10 TaxID=3047873 RepID=UPI0024C1F412|nr:hypothetical protein [Neobacillus sp. WH10]WHY79450.1 hypothetical protein QNH20_10045 [Neobacillus sp. WH10]